MSARSRAAGLAAAGLALALASCARAPQPVLELDTVAARYAVARDHREALLRAYSAELVVRVDGRGTGRLPALPATLELATPDHVRLRASALLGVAIDVLVAHDSIWAWVPSQKLAFGAPGESLGLAASASWAGRVMGAVWSPPRQAWERASADSAGWWLGWREGADTLALRVSRDGLPQEAWQARGERGVRVRYREWTRVRGEPLPARCELADDAGWARVRIDCLEARSQDEPEADWFRPRRVPGWRQLAWDDIRSVLEGGGRP